MRWRRWLIYLASFIGILLFVAFPIAASFLITNSRFRFPERGPQNPEAVGLPVEVVRFSSSDGVPLEGWWSPGEPQQPVILFSHGLNRSRLELLERAAEAHKRGYGVLLFDLRNHGQSGRAYTTLGIHESRDVCAASKTVFSMAPDRGQVLWGVSMGAATDLLAVRDCGGFEAVVSDSAFVSFRETVAHHLNLYFHLPRFPIANLIVGITAMRLGIDPDDGDVESAVRGFGDVPVLIIAGAADRRMPPDVAQRLFDAASSTDKELLVIPAAGHGEAFRTDRDRYLESVFGFLARADRKAAGARH
jgi:alpha-beta hydrolase superfamily lysophospholipase